jgi:hypothetical protein
VWFEPEYYCKDCVYVCPGARGVGAVCGWVGTGTLFVCGRIGVWGEVEVSMTAAGDGQSGGIGVCVCAVCLCGGEGLG